MNKLKTKTRFRSSFVALCLCFTLTTSCASSDVSDSTENSKSGWLKIKSGKYSVQYPDSLTLDTSGQLGTKFFIFFPVRSANDKFSENVNLITQDLPGQKINLKEITKVSEEIKKIITDCEIIDKSIVEVNGESFGKLEYTGKQGEFDLHWTQLYYADKKTLYVLTFTAEQTSQESFKSVAEKIWNTISIE